MLTVILLIGITGLTFVLILLYLLFDYLKVVNSQPSHNKKKTIAALRWFLGFNILNTIWNFSLFKTDPHLMLLAWAGYFSLVWAASKYFGDGSNLKSVAYSILTININLFSQNAEIDTTNRSNKIDDEAFKKHNKLYKKLVDLKKLCLDALTNLDESYEPVKEFNIKVAEFDLALDKAGPIISDAIQTIMLKLAQQMDTRINGFNIAKSSADMYNQPSSFRHPSTSLRLENYDLIKEQYSDFVYGELTNSFAHLKKNIKQKDVEKHDESIY